LILIAYDSISNIVKIGTTHKTHNQITHKHNIMSLMASAQRMRMKKKREKVTSPTNGGKATTTTTISSIVSPRNNNNDGKEDVPSGTGNNGRGGGSKQTHADVIHVLWILVVGLR